MSCPETVTGIELDERWEWEEITTFSDPEPRFIRSRCRHLERVPVRSIVLDAPVAELCLTCDQQLSVPWPEAPQ
jgi:hypothetical protein